MGVEHGAFCLGCCWFLMALLFVGGIWSEMNMPAKTLGRAFQEMQPVLDTFRRNYIKVLEVALKRFEVGNLRVCTVYNGILDLPTIEPNCLGPSQ